MLRAILLLSLILAQACAERPRIGVELGTQRIQDCIPGSVSKPCP